MVAVVSLAQQRRTAACNSGQAPAGAPSCLAIANAYCHMQRSGRALSLSETLTVPCAGCRGHQRVHCTKLPLHQFITLTI